MQRWKWIRVHNLSLYRYIIMYHLACIIMYHLACAALWLWHLTIKVKDSRSSVVLSSLLFLGLQCGEVLLFVSGSALFSCLNLKVVGNII